MAAPGTGWVKPKAAVATYGISRGTLHNWARAGLISVSHVGRCAWYLASDIEDLIERGRQPRTVVPLPAAPAQAATTTATGYRWDADPYWTGGPAAP